MDRSFFSSSYWLQPASKKRAVWLFFGAFLVLGLFIYRDFGVPWDDIYSRENGQVTLKYLFTIFNPDYLLQHDFCPECPPLHEYVDTDHAPLFELIPTGLELIFKTDMRESLFIRHLCVFLLFWLACIYFYKLIRNRFNSTYWGLLGAVLLLLSPRIFADAFFNSKDLPFLSLIIISLFTIWQYLKYKTVKTAIWCALACALATDIRLMAIMLPLLLLVFCSIDFIKNVNPQIPKTQKSVSLLLFVLFYAGFVVLFWPYLWEAPVTNIIQAFKSLSQFRWTDSNLYYGELVKATELPWHYSLSWIFLTTPVPISLLFFIGSLVIIYRLFKNKWQLYKSVHEQQDLIQLALFSGSVLAVIVLHSVLYDGWRQLFYVYPAMLAVALVGLHFLVNQVSWKKNWVAKLLAIGFGIYMVATAVWMVRNHPNQNVYFSFIGGRTAFKNFDRDYWGLSYRQALEELLTWDQSEKIKIATNYKPGYYNSLILTEAQRNRLEYVPVSEATYFLTEHRFHPFELPWQADQENAPAFNQLFYLRVDGGRILTVYKLD